MKVDETSYNIESALNYQDCQSLIKKLEKSKKDRLLIEIKDKNINSIEKCCVISDLKFDCVVLNKHKFNTLRVIIDVGEFISCLELCYESGCWVHLSIKDSVSPVLFEYAPEDDVARLIKLDITIEDEIKFNEIVISIKDISINIEDTVSAIITINDVVVDFFEYLKDESLDESPDSAYDNQNNSDFKNLLEKVFEAGADEAKTFIYAYIDEELLQLDYCKKIRDEAEELLDKKRFLLISKNPYENWKWEVRNGKNNERTFYSSLQEIIKEFA